jgi:hypothetical protein
MDQSRSSQPPPPLSTTANPVVAVGRKVKSMLTSHQRPSVRIQRGGARPVPATQDFAEKPLPQLPPREGANSNTEFVAPDAVQTEKSADLSSQNTFTSRFAGVRNRTGSTVKSLFSRGRSSVQDDKPFENENEYDTSTVELLDVMGMSPSPSRSA